MNPFPHSSLPLLLLVAFTAVLSTGCQTYQQKNKVAAVWRQGNVNAAVTEAQKAADENAKNKDAIIWRLEHGAALRAAGKFEESNRAFEQAQLRIDEYAQKAKVRLGQEAGALLSNQAELDYEGRSYDGIMLNTYRALNYLALGEIEKARPEMFHAYQRQQDAVEANKKRISDAQEAAEKAKDKEAIKKAQTDPKTQGALSGCTANLSSMTFYADYVNPFTTYLDGLYFHANAADTSDLERARKSFERTAEFAPNNAFVKADLAAVEETLKGKALPPTTYVVFETGCAPERDQIRVDIPIIVTKVSYVGAAFPTLKLQDNYLSSLLVTTGETNVTTALVGSMDSIIALDFKNELPAVITKTIASTVTKTVAAYAVNEAARQGGGDIGGLIAQIGTAVYQMSVNIADERTWTTLPKEFQIARIPTPADGRVVVSSGGQKAEAKVDKDSVNLVYVKSIAANTPLIVYSMKLNGAPLSAVRAKVSSIPRNTSAPVVPLVSAEPRTSEGGSGGLDGLGRLSAKPVVAVVSPGAAVQGGSPAQVSGAVLPQTPEVRSLVESLAVGDRLVVIGSLQRLQRVGTAEVVPHVLPLLKGGDVLIVREACRTLASIGAVESVPALRQLLDNRELHGEAQEAIVRIARSHPKDSLAAF